MRGLNIPKNYLMLNLVIIWFLLISLLKLFGRKWHESVNNTYCRITQHSHYEFTRSSHYACTLAEPQPIHILFLCHVNFTFNFKMLFQFFQHLGWGEIYTVITFVEIIGHWSYYNIADSIPMRQCKEASSDGACVNTIDQHCVNTWLQ